MIDNKSEIVKEFQRLSGLINAGQIKKIDINLNQVSEDRFTLSGEYQTKDYINFYPANDFTKEKVLQKTIALELTDYWTVEFWNTDTPDEYKKVEFYDPDEAENFYNKVYSLYDNTILSQYYQKILKNELDNRYVNTRSAQIYDDGEIKDIHPKDIRKGMLFRLFESDGTPVCGSYGWHIAATDSLQSLGGVYTVDILE